MPSPAVVPSTDRSQRDLLDYHRKVGKPVTTRPDMSQRSFAKVSFDFEMCRHNRRPPQPFVLPGLMLALGGRLQEGGWDARKLGRWDARRLGGLKQVKGVKEVEGVEKARAPPWFQERAFGRGCLFVAIFWVLQAPQLRADIEQLITFERSPTLVASRPPRLRRDRPAGDARCPYFPACQRVRIRILRSSVKLQFSM